MPFHTTILYKKEEGDKFDLDYYVKKHMPLASALFLKHGLKTWNVVEYGPGADGAKPPFAVGLNLVWDNAEQMGAALSSPEAGPVFGDVPNFTNGSPILMAGHVVASL